MQKPVNCAEAGISQVLCTISAKSAIESRILSVTQRGKVIDGNGSRQEGLPEAFLQTTKLSQSPGEDAALSFAITQNTCVSSKRNLSLSMK